MSSNHEKMFVWNASIWVGGPCTMWKENRGLHKLFLAPWSSANYECYIHYHYLFLACNAFFDSIDAEFFVLFLISKTLLTLAWVKNVSIFLLNSILHRVSVSNLTSYCKIICMHQTKIGTFHPLWNVCPAPAFWRTFYFRSSICRLPTLTKH